jgi:hypothetical protein
MVLEGKQRVPIVNDGPKVTLDLSKAEKGQRVTVVRLQENNAERPKKTANKLPAEKDKRLHSDGSSWGYKHVEDNGSGLPRVLLIGDSILNGYRGHVASRLKGEAIVDVWLTPHFQSDEFNKLLGETLEHESYDVVHFNLGLHGWQKGRIRPGTYKPLTRAMVEVIKAKQPNARLIWASSTPVTVRGEPEQLDPEVNPVIVEHNLLAAEVMGEMHVPVNDYYGLLVDRLKLARGDQYHWNQPAYTILGEQAAESIRTALAEGDTAEVSHRDAAGTRE